MNYFIKYLHLLFIMSLFFCCSKREDIDIDWGGPDPLAYTYQTKWVLFENLKNDGEWETIKNGDTLILSFNYESEANLISESNGVYMIYNSFLENKIVKNGYFKTADNIFTFIYTTDKDQNEVKKLFSFSTLESNKGIVGDIITFADNNIDPISAIKFKNIEYKKIK